MLKGLNDGENDSVVAAPPALVISFHRYWYSAAEGDDDDDAFRSCSAFLAVTQSMPKDPLVEKDGANATPDMAGTTTSGTCSARACARPNSNENTLSLSTGAPLLPLLLAAVAAPVVVIRTVKGVASTVERYVDKISP